MKIDDLVIATLCAVVAYSLIKYGGHGADTEATHLGITALTAIAATWLGYVFGQSQKSGQGGGEASFRDVMNSVILHVSASWSRRMFSPGS